jgi:hypothetical protein
MKFKRVVGLLVIILTVMTIFLFKIKPMLAEGEVAPPSCNTEYANSVLGEVSKVNIREDGSIEVTGFALINGHDHGMDGKNATHELIITDSEGNVIATIPSENNGKDYSNLPRDLKFDQTALLYLKTEEQPWAMELAAGGTYVDNKGVKHTGWDAVYALLEDDRASGRMKSPGFYENHYYKGVGYNFIIDPEKFDFDPCFGIDPCEGVDPCEEGYEPGPKVVDIEELTGKKSTFNMSVRVTTNDAKCGRVSATSSVLNILEDRVKPNEESGTILTGTADKEVKAVSQKGYAYDPERLMKGIRRNAGGYLKPDETFEVNNEYYTDSNTPFLSDIEGINNTFIAIYAQKTKCNSKGKNCEFVRCSPGTAGCETVAIPSSWIDPTPGGEDGENKNTTMEFQCIADCGTCDGKVCEREDKNLVCEGQTVSFTSEDCDEKLYWIPKSNYYCNIKCGESSKVILPPRPSGIKAGTSFGFSVSITNELFCEWEDGPYNPNSNPNGGLPYFERKVTKAEDALEKAKKGLEKTIDEYPSSLAAAEEAVSEAQKALVDAKASGDAKKIEEAKSKLSSARAILRAVEESVPEAEKAVEKAERDLESAIADKEKYIRDEKSCEDWYAYKEYRPNPQIEVDVDGSDHAEYVNELVGGGMAIPGADPKLDAIVNMLYGIPSISIQRYTGVLSPGGGDYSGSGFFTSLSTPTGGGGNLDLKITGLNVKPYRNAPWVINYDCSYSVYNEFPPSGFDDYLFRPISLSDPFPNRAPRGNWSGKNNLISVTKNGVPLYNRDNLIYGISLDMWDLINIRKYNFQKSYLDLSFNSAGRSQFIHQQFPGLFNKGRGEITR